MLKVLWKTYILFHFILPILKHFEALLWQFCSLRFKITASVLSATNEQRILGLERRVGRGRLEEEEEM